MGRPVVGIFASNPYIVTNMRNGLDWRVKADLVIAYNVEEALGVCKESKPEIIIVDSSLADAGGPKDDDLPKIFKDYKVILLTSLKSLASMNTELKNVIEIIEKPASILALANALKKHLSSEQKPGVPASK
jgi:ActR/RegA family two-component response regulator